MGLLNDVVNAGEQFVQSLPPPPAGGSSSGGDSSSSTSGNPPPAPGNPVPQIVALVQAIDTSVTPVLTPAGPSPIPVPYPAGLGIWLDSVLADNATVARAMLSDLKDRVGIKDHMDGVGDTNQTIASDIQRHAAVYGEIVDSMTKGGAAAMSIAILICMSIAEQEGARTAGQNAGGQQSPPSGPPPSTVVPRVMLVVARMLGSNQPPLVRSLAAQELERIARSLPGLARPWRRSPKSLQAVRPALERIEAVLAKWSVGQKRRSTAPDFLAATERLRHTLRVCVAHSRRVGIVRGNAVAAPSSF